MKSAFLCFLFCSKINARGLRDFAHKNHLLNVYFVCDPPETRANALFIARTHE